MSATTSISDLLQRHGFADRLDEALYTVRHMLLQKNAAYGNSALDPVRIFSSASPVEQIKVRLDDKLSRLARGDAAGEDVEADLLGYLFLLRIARHLESELNDANAPGAEAPSKEPAHGADDAECTTLPAPSVETNVSPRPAAPAFSSIADCRHRWMQIGFDYGDGPVRRCVVCGLKQRAKLA